jgi:hypothetical protein
MKKLILILAVLFFAGSLFSQAGSYLSYNPHDSLLFDGSATINTVFDDTPCRPSVRSVEGTVIGTVFVGYKFGDVCGEKDTIEIYEKRQLKPGDLLKPGTDIESESGAEAYFLMPNGFVFSIYGKNKMNIPASVCDLINMNQKLFILNIPGTIHLLSHGLTEGKRTYEISTPAFSVTWSGTEFSVIGTDDENTVKVYDGTVEVELKKYDDSEVKNYNEELKKLTDDFQSGKISMEEYTKKAKELGEKAKDLSKKSKMKISIEAGYMVKVGKSFGDVTPIPPDDKKLGEK